MELIIKAISKVNMILITAVLAELLTAEQEVESINVETTAMHDETASAPKKHLCSIPFGNYNQLFPEDNYYLLLYMWHNCKI